MKINIVTIFPEFFAAPLALSIPGRAVKAGLVEYNVVDLREPILKGRPRTGENRMGITTGKVTGDHGSPPWSSMNAYHNTLVVSSTVADSADLWMARGANAERPRNVFNNVFLHLGGLRNVRLTDTPAYVMDARYDILAWNPLATHFIGDLARVPERDRNVIRWAFTSPRASVDWDDPESAGFARASVADLRSALARYPGDRGIQELVTELLAASPRFAAMWDEHEVAVRRTVTKRIDHPVAGCIEASCQVLHIPDTDQRVVLYVVTPGTPFHAAMRRLRDLDERGTAACVGAHVSDELPVS